MFLRFSLDGRGDFLDFNARLSGFRWDFEPRRRFHADFFLLRWSVLVYVYLHLDLG